MAEIISNERPLIADRPREFVGSGGVDAYQMSGLWDRIVLTDPEDEAVKAMSVIVEVDRIALTGEASAAQARLPIARLRGKAKPVPLRSLGDGAYRVFGLAVSLANSAGGFCLIDEIENGIHYSVQADVWRSIFSLAHRLDVQVFATTHSWDMVKAFQLAANESEEEGVLIRLAQKAGQTIVAEFDEHELEVAVEGQIEVR